MCANIARGKAEAVNKTGVVPDYYPRKVYVAGKALASIWLATHAEFPL